MIDSGRQEGEDAKYLYQLLKEHGGRVDLWLFTHAHDDHFGALQWLLKNQPDFDIEIADMRLSFPPVEWFRIVENGGSYEPNRDFAALLAEHGITPTPLHAGDVITCGELTIDVLSDSSNYLNYDNINDTTSVLRVHFPKRDVLFSRDLGWVAGAELLKTVPMKRCAVISYRWHTMDRTAPIVIFTR